MVKTEKKIKSVKKLITQMMPIIFFMIIGGFCGYLGGDYIGQLFANNESIAIRVLKIGMGLIALYIAIFIQIIIHEGGHLICGKMSGYSFASFRIGSVMIIKDREKVKFKKFKLPGTGGQCLMIPPRGDIYDFPFVLYNLGGSLANLVASGLFGVLYLIFPDIPYLSVFFAISAVIGVVFALINGIPLRLSGVDNDGHNIMVLSKNREARKAFWRQLYINGLITKGTRLKDMPEEWFSLPENANLNNGIISSMGVFACSRAIDEMDFQKAREIGNTMLENSDGLMGIHRNLLCCELLFCEMIGENRKEEVDRLYTKELKKFIKVTAAYLSTIRLMYAYYLFIEQDEEKAEKQLVAFEKASRFYPHECEVKGERELLSYVQKKYYYIES